MRRIINNKMYNTNTATLVGEYNDGDGDYTYLCEELYIKKTGEWFLYGSGGALTIYCENCGDGLRSGGSKIIPYKPEQAKEWLVEHNYVDEYIKYFGEPEE